MAAAHLTRLSRRRAHEGGVRSPTWAFMAHAHGAAPSRVRVWREGEGGAWASLAHPPLAAAPPPPFLEGGLISPLAPYIKDASP